MESDKEWETLTNDFDRLTGVARIDEIEPGLEGDYLLGMNRYIACGALGSIGKIMGQAVPRGCGWVREIFCTKYIPSLQSSHE